MAVQAKCIISIYQPTLNEQYNENLTNWLNTLTIGKKHIPKKNAKPKYNYNS
jgi:hypothetical protein